MADHGLGLHGSDLNQGPAMPVDQELLDSIQFLSDPVWQDTTMPGEPFLPSFLSLDLALPHFVIHRGGGLISLSFRFQLGQPTKSS